MLHDKPALVKNNSFVRVIEKGILCPLTDYIVKICIHRALLIIVFEYLRYFKLIAEACSLNRLYTVN